MKSFPSSLNESQAMYGSGKYSTYSSTFDIERLKALNLNLSAPVITELLKEKNINISNFNKLYTENITMYPKADEGTFRENPLMLPYDIISLAKKYNWEYKQPSLTVMGVDPNDAGKYTAHIQMAPSMFSPFNGVNVKGITSNVPLLNNVNSNSPYLKNRDNITSCTIRELCTLSKNPNSVLGMATYKYADFMYCKDLGKVSNNHLITLRRFAHPVGDHIFELSGPQYVAEKFGFDQPGDIGRLVTWFDTDDNRLEDIIKFSYRTTWKHLDAKIQEEESTADDKTTGVLGMLSNTISGTYAHAAANGVSGNHDLFGYIGQKLIGNDVYQGIGKNNGLLRNYDENRVYNPKNTIQETHMYEGKIEFTHEFTLNFSYKLRAYDNINPKSAFLDLIGNILEVTGRRGRFWGGERKLIGPPTDTSMFTKTEALIDKAFDKIGGMWQNMEAMGFNIGSICGALSNLVGQAIGAAGALISEGVEGVKQVLQDGNAKDIVTEQIKGKILNALGRPTMIAWNSLLDGSDVGLWHVTIGNPKNPIMAMGNLILTNSEITQSGPLGLDDFPTELKVSISLKHARPRDITDISKMYTKGMASIYHPLAPAGLENYLSAFNGYSSASSNKSSKEIREMQKPKSEKDKQTSSTTTNSIDNQSQAMTDLMRAQATDYKENFYNADYIIPNPFLDDTLSKKMAQMNNYSSVMAVLSADEVI
jgi:hypothetical protein